MICGGNDQGLIGSKMVIETQASFMPRHLQDKGRTSGLLDDDGVW